MVDAGTTSSYIDVQDCTLTNINDGKTYVKTTNITLDFTKNVAKRQLTNRTVDNNYSLVLNAIYGNIILTEPEINDWTDLFISSDTKIWRVSYTSFSNVTKTIDVNAEVLTFRSVRDNVGVTEMFFRLECDEVVAVT